MSYLYQDDLHPVPTIRMLSSFDLNDHIAFWHGDAPEAEKATKPYFRGNDWKVALRCKPSF